MARVGARRDCAVDIHDVNRSAAASGWVTPNQDASGCPATERVSASCRQRRDRLAESAQRQQRVRTASYVEEVLHSRRARVRCVRQMPSTASRADVGGGGSRGSHSDRSQRGEAVATDRARRFGGRGARSRHVASSGITTPLTVDTASVARPGAARITPTLARARGPGRLDRERRCDTCPERRDEGSTKREP